MRLVVQIPCRDEVATLAAVVREIPASIEGVSSIAVLVLDDGSRDGSAELARALGVSVLRLQPDDQGSPVGLAQAYARGLRESLRLGADVLVNLDGDGQYNAGELPRLLRPILNGEAELVIGDRAPHRLRHFTLNKRLLQRLGGVVVRVATGLDVADPVSGYRALTRSAAQALQVRSTYTYTIETLFQAAELGFRVQNVPIVARPTPRPSRLMRSNGDYLWRAGLTAARAMLRHRPIPLFIGMFLLPLLIAGVYPRVAIMLALVIGLGGLIAESARRWRRGVVRGFG